jgi:RNA polymerase sigma-70 factor (ECF subfamily)
MTDHQAPPDAAVQLLARLVAGDDAAYAAVFREWYAPLVRFTETLLRQRDEAEEVVQEVMLELWHRRATIDPTRPVQAWLFRSARNRALNVLRHARVVQHTEPVVQSLAGAPPPADALVAERDLDAALHEALAELPPRCRDVFLRSRRDGLRNAEIADQLGISVKAVEGLIGRALKALRTRMQPWLPNNDG